MPLLLLLFTGSALAQQGLVLAPASHCVKAGESVSVTAQAETNGKLAPREWPGEIAWYFVRLAGTQENRGAEDAPKPEGNGVRVPLPRAGAAMVGLDLPAREREWTPDELAAFASKAGIRAPGVASTVRHAVSATTLVRVDAAFGSPAPDVTPTSKSGQGAEIRPLMDPTSMPSPCDVPVRVYAEGDGVANAEVIVTHEGTGESRRVRADSKGIALATIDRAGRWRVEVSVLRPPEKDSKVWRAWSASLTFESPGVTKKAGEP